MPRKRFTNERGAFALRQAQNGATVDEVCRKGGGPSLRSTSERNSSSAWVAGDPAAQAAGRRERQAQEVGGRPDAGPLDIAGCPDATAVRPCARREVAGHMQGGPRLEASVGPARPPASVACRLSQRYRKRSDPQVALRMRLKELAVAHVLYAYRRLHTPILPAACLTGGPTSTGSSSTSPDQADRPTTPTSRRSTAVYRRSA